MPYPLSQPLVPHRKPMFNGAFYVSDLEARFPPVPHAPCPYTLEIQAACRMMRKGECIEVELPFTLARDQERELRGRIEDVGLAREWRFTVELSGQTLTIKRRT